MARHRREDGPYNFSVVGLKDGKSYEVRLAPPGVDARGGSESIVVVGTVIRPLGEEFGKMRMPDQKFMDEFKWEERKGWKRFTWQGNVYMAMIELFLERNSELKAAYTRYSEPVRDFPLDVQKHNPVVVEEAMYTATDMKTYASKVSALTAYNFYQMLIKNRQPTDTTDIVVREPDKIVSSGSGSRTGGFEGTYNKYIHTWMLNDEFVVAARKVYCEGLPIAGDRDLMVSRIVKYKEQPLSEREKIITFAYLIDEHDEKTLRNLIDRLGIKIGKTTAFNQHIWKWRIMICVLGWEITDKFNMSPANARPYYSLDEMIMWIKEVISDDANCRDQVPVLIADYLLGEDNPRPFRYSTVVAALREMTHRDTKYCKYCKTCNVDNHCEYRLVTSKEDQ